MGVASIVLGILGVCVCWLPTVGWLGVAMGAFACGLGVPSITHWFERPGHTGWGVAGIAMGVIAMSVGFAYQVKHADGALDFLYHALPAEIGCCIAGAAGAIIVVGLLIARKKSRLKGIAMAALAIAVCVVFSGWSLTSADRALDRVGLPSPQINR